MTALELLLTQSSIKTGTTRDILAGVQMKVYGIESEVVLEQVENIVEITQEENIVEITQVENLVIIEEII